MEVFGLVTFLVVQCVWTNKLANDECLEPHQVAWGGFFITVLFFGIIEFIGSLLIIAIQVTGCCV